MLNIFLGIFEQHLGYVLANNSSEFDRAGVCKRYIACKEATLVTLGKP